LTLEGGDMTTLPTQNAVYRVKSGVDSRDSKGNTAGWRQLQRLV
jgi:hypothetical protein